MSHLVPLQETIKQGEDLWAHMIKNGKLKVIIEREHLKKVMYIQST